MNTPRIVTIVRSRKSKDGENSIREITRHYLSRERISEFVWEVIFFVLIAAISAWPVFHMAEALRLL